MIVGFVLSLLTAVFWSGLDVTRKKLIANVTTWAAVAGLTAFQLPILAVLLGAGEFFELQGQVASLLLPTLPEDLAAEYWLWAGATIFLNLLANYFFFRSVEESPLSLTIPYLSFTPVFSAFAGLAFLGEIPDALGWVGIMVVTLGAFLLNRGNPEDGLLAPLTALRSEIGSVYMVGVALIWSLSPVVDKLATTASNPVWHTAVIALGMSSSIIAYRVATDGDEKSVFAEFRDEWKLFAVCAAFNVGAMVIQLAAYTFIEVAYVETVKRGVGVIGAMAAGYFLFGESDIARRVLGGVVMAAGVALLLL